MTDTLVKFDEYPSLTVAVLTFNSMETLPWCLESLDRLKYRTDILEFVFVDGGSTDGSLETLRRFARSTRARTTILEEVKGEPRSRQAALEAARGEIVAFTDSDCYVDEDWAIELISGYWSASIAGVGGKTLYAGPLDTALRIYFKYLQERDLRGISQPREVELPLPGFNSSFRREDALQAGGFNPSLLFGDTELCLRILKRGYSFVINPKAIVHHAHHHHLRSVLSFLARRSAAAHSWYQIRRLHGQLLDSICCASPSLRVRQILTDLLNASRRHDVPFLFVQMAILTTLKGFVEQLGIRGLWWSPKTLDSLLGRS